MTRPGWGGGYYDTLRGGEDMAGYRYRQSAEGASGPWQGFSSVTGAMTARALQGGWRTI